AEGERFELSDGFHRLRFSRPVQSATLPPLRHFEETWETSVFAAFPHCSTRLPDRPSESTEVPNTRFGNDKQDARMLQPVARKSPPDCRVQSQPLSQEGES